MIGMTLFHGQSNTTGKVDAAATHPDGKHLVRIDDHWFFRDECQTQNPELLGSGSFIPFIVIVAFSIVCFGLAILGT